MVLIKQSRKLCKVTILNIKVKNWNSYKLFISYEKGVAEKLKRVARKYVFTTVFTKTKDLRGQIRAKQKDKIETLGVVYEEDCNNYLKKNTGRKKYKLERKNKRTKR